MFAPAFRRLIVVASVAVALMVLHGPPSIRSAQACTSYPTCQNVIDYYTCCNGRLLAWGVADGQIGYCISDVTC
jgi:hypothetical protein